MKGTTVNASPTDMQAKDNTVEISAQSKNTKSGISPTVTTTPKTPETAGISLTKSNSSSSDKKSSNTRNSSSHNAQAPQEHQSTAQYILTPTTVEQATDVATTPTEVSVVKTGTLSISGNSCSSDSNAVCPTPTPQSNPGVGSGNTVSIQYREATPTPSSTGGDVRVTTGESVTETP